MDDACPNALKMPGKTKFQIIKGFLEPHVGKLVHVEYLRTLMIRNLGTSGTSVISHLKFAVEAKLMVEEEPFKYRILKVTEII